jgi:methanogenic corrinoid protein MtbC1
MPDSGRGVFADRGLSQDEAAGFSRLKGALWCPSEDTAPPPELRGDLARTIEDEIIPRLMLAHRAAALPTPKAPAATAIIVTDQDVARFAEMIVHQPLDAARAHLDGLRAAGMSAEAVITGVLSATARHLGVLWEQDRCTFVDVTLGLSRLQQLLRIFGPAFEAEPARQGSGRRLLLAVVPGEQHTFGLAIVEEFFRRAGWHVQSEFLPSRAILLEQVRTEWFDAVGLSASGEVASASVGAVVKAVRDHALNTGVRIMLGGNLFVGAPELAASLGADFGARDAAEAVDRIEEILDGKKISC